MAETTMSRGESIELDPDFSWPHHNKGRAYARLGEHRQAIMHYGRAIEVDSNYAEAYHYRGLAHMILGDHRLAIDDLNKALTLTRDPEDRAAIEKALSAVQQ